MQVTQETLATVGKQVLETMAFAFEMPGQNVPADGEEILRAAVAFEGPVRGCLSLTMPKTMLPVLAANMLGEDEDTVLPEQQQHDALGELANVICGNVVQALAGPQPVFRLDSPRIDPNPAPGSSPASGQSLTSTCISLESGWVELVLCVEDGPGAEVAPRACVPTTSAR